MSEEAMTLEEAQRRYDAAAAELDRICQGPRDKFRMRIPAQRDDSDLILSAALVALRDLIEASKADPAQELQDAVIEWFAWRHEATTSTEPDQRLFAASQEVDAENIVRRLVGMEDSDAS